LTLRVKIQNEPGKLGEIATMIGNVGGDIGAIDIVSVGKDRRSMTRKLSVQSLRLTESRYFRHQTAHF
jgi:malate dehydrogenase (oxaloacetate-decarboxylating)